MAQPSRPPGAGAADAEMVSAALAGDRDAFAAIYDAYADRIHTMCVHLLGDRDEAADVTGDVFLVAFQRLGQLREPSKLRSWLYAICRHEIYRRTEQRQRTHLVDEMNELERLGGSHDPVADDSADPAELAGLLRAAAVGLDDRDRTVLELQLQGVDGEELAAAMGTSVSSGYQLVHRMRERLERSLGALLVARHGRGECNDLDQLLTGWDGTFSVVWRKRVARHVDRCEVCERRRRAVPATLFGTAGAAPLVATPTSVRTRVLDAAGVASSARAAERWRADGFPPGDAGRNRRLPLLAGAAALLLLLGGTIVAVALGQDDAAITVADRRGPVESAPAPTAPGATTSVVAAPGSAVPSSAAPSSTPPTTSSGQPTGTTAPIPTTRPGRTTVPTSAPVTSTTMTTTTAAATTTTRAPAPPTLRLSGPTTLSARAATGGECANQQFRASILSGTPTAVTLRWTAGAASGSVAMARTRLAGNVWTATVHLPFGTTGSVSVRAEATAGGAIGASNTLPAVATACPVIG